ncbi:hypothetical protein Hdeb2414_s0010g00352351 [Helianthus debilis subsp. tardiflorus]
MRKLKDLFVMSSCSSSSPPVEEIGGHGGDEANRWRDNDYDLIFRRGGGGVVVGRMVIMVECGDGG